uniref:Uncharacterized protein n=1 Tax=Myoviridae sp. ctBtT5 TaxID=2825048 RepID=A0A8S5PZU7_9CAUD|nr:MAG TPA: hypothetical protein [Myoviridae sp. ctBtT5]
MSAPTSIKYFFIRILSNSIKSIDGCFYPIT